MDLSWACGGAVYCKRIASLCTGRGVGFREGPKSFNHAK